jgi:hypothetical protein
MNTEKEDEKRPDGVVPKEGQDEEAVKQATELLAKLKAIDAEMQSQAEVVEAYFDKYYEYQEVAEELASLTGEHDIVIVNDGWEIEPGEEIYGPDAWVPSSMGC